MLQAKKKNIKKEEGKSTRNLLYGLREDENRENERVSRERQQVIKVYWFRRPLRDEIKF